LALENNDLQEFNQCQSVLKTLYEIDKIPGHMTEFMAYRLLYFIYSNNISEIGKFLRILTPELQKDPAIKHALQVREAFFLKNYHQFFKLYQNVPNKGKGLMDMLISDIRKQALLTIIKAYRPSISISWFQQELGFQNLISTMNFLRNYDIKLTENKTEIDCKNSNPLF
jgi:hypothetical protein